MFEDVRSADFPPLFLVQECKREGNFKFQEGLYEEVSTSIPIGVSIVSVGRARSVVGLTYLQPS